ncbi:MAG: DUF2849 domain-containing protein [Hyphomicrobiales bacterium]
MAKKPKGPRLLTANRLDDGLVVFYTAGGEWQDDARRAAIARDEEEAALLETFGATAAKANLVVSPYLIEVELDGETPVPVEHRERRRLAGPSVTADHRAAASLAA